MLLHLHKARTTVLLSVTITNKPVYVFSSARRKVIFRPLSFLRSVLVATPEEKKSRAARLQFVPWSPRVTCLVRGRAGSTHMQLLSQNYQLIEDGVKREMESVNISTKCVIIIWTWGADCAPTEETVTLLHCDAWVRSDICNSALKFNQDNFLFIYSTLIAT